MATAYSRVRARHSHYGELRHNTFLVVLFIIAGLVGLLFAALLLHERNPSTLRHMLAAGLVVTAGWHVQLWRSSKRQERITTHLLRAKRYRVAAITSFLIALGMKVAPVSWATPYGKALTCTVLFAFALGCLIKAGVHWRRDRLKRLEKRSRH